MRRHVLPVLVWTVICGLFFGTILLGWERLPGGDFSGQFHAFGLFQAREMAQGHFPFWSPYSHAGVPFAADPQSAAYYLPRWLTILLSRPWGFPYLALEWEAVLHIWLAGVFTYALAYAICSRRTAALVGAVAFALGGYLTSYPVLQLAILETITWLPLVLLLLRLGVESERPVPRLVAAGLVLALAALAGHPQTLLHISYVAVAYYLYLAVRARWSWRWVVGLGAMVAFVAVGGALAMLLPALRYAPYTIRSQVGYEFVASGLPMLDYLQVFVPGTLSLWSPQYVGVVGITLAVLALWSRRESKRPEITFWAVMALCSAWLALGDAGILFELPYRLLPGFQFFQHQERLLGVFSLSCGLLAAQGMAVWLQAGTDSSRLLSRRSLATAGAGLLLAGLILAVALGGSDQSWPSVWVRQAAVLLVVAAVLCGTRWREQRAWALVILLSGELYVVSLGAMDRQPGPASAFWPQPEWAQTLASTTPSRIDSGRTFFGNLGDILGLEDIGGISPLRPRALDDLKPLPAERRWQLLNVTHVLASSPPEDAPVTKVAEVVQSLDPDRPMQAGLYRFDAALPRAWMSYTPVPVPDAAAALQMLSDPAFDPATEVILQGEVTAAGQASTPPAGQAEVEVTRSGSAALAIEVQTETSGWLVISEWHYPGWEAWLDGTRVTLQPANYAFQAIEVPAGVHQVTLRYVPALEVAAALGSLLVLALAAVVAWRWRPVVTRRRSTWSWGLTQPSERRPLPQGRLWLCLAVALILLGFGLRVYGAGSQELRGDEATSYLFAERPLGDILPMILRTGDPHPPLHYWLLHGWMGIVGQSEFAMRYASLIPSVLLLALVFRFGRRLGGVRLGVLVLGLLAVSQSQVWLAQDLRNQYALAMVFSMLATLLFARAIEQPTWPAWGLYAVACALTLYSHYYGAFALAAHGLALLVMPAWRARWWRWSLAVGLAALAFMPWLLLTLPQLAGAGQLSDPSRPELAAHLSAIGTELAAGSGLSPRVGRWLFLGSLGLCIAGACDLYRRARGWAVLLAGWVAAAALGIYLLRFSRATFNAYYILVASMAWWALAGLGIVWLWRQKRRWSRPAAVMSLAVVVLANAVSLGGYYYNPAYSRSSGYRSLATYLAEVSGPGDVFLRNFPDPCYDYYLRYLPLPRAMQPETRDAGLEETQQALAELSATCNRLWFAPAAGSVWDPEGAVWHWLEYNTLLERETKHDRISLLAYRPLHAAEEVMTPLDLPLAGMMRLAGVYVTVNGTPADLSAPALLVPAGATVRVTLLWEGLAETEASYTVFVHLLGDDNQMVAQHDGVPAFGTRPTRLWAPGDLVLDRHDLDVPADVAPGQATLLVGVYRSETVERQLFPDGRDALVLARVTLAGN